MDPHGGSGPPPGTPEEIRASSRGCLVYGLAVAIGLGIVAAALLFGDQSDADPTVGVPLFALLPVVGAAVAFFGLGVSWSLWRGPHRYVIADQPRFEDDQSWARAVWRTSREPRWHWVRLVDAASGEPLGWIEVDRATQRALVSGLCTLHGNPRRRTGLALRSPRGDLTRIAWLSREAPAGSRPI